MLDDFVVESGSGEDEWGVEGDTLDGEARKSRWAQVNWARVEGLKYRCEGRGARSGADHHNHHHST